jgi:hypothetical protein
MHPIVSLVLATAIALVATGAEAVMCVKKSGGVVVRDACRKRETPISTAHIPGAQGPAGADGAPGERGEKGETGEFRVVDSTGRFVGFVDIGHSDTIAIRVPGVGVALFSSADDGQGFDEYDDLALYHESTDCKGDAFVLPSRSNLIPWAPVHGEFAYFPHLPGGPRVISSMEYAIDSCPTTLTERGLCCANFTDVETFFLTKVTPVPVASLGTPPFRAAD